MKSKQVKWMPLREAMERCHRKNPEIRNIKDKAERLAAEWQCVKPFLIDGTLQARGRVSGALRDIHPYWLSVLKWDVPDGDTLWFREEKRYLCSPVAPARIDRIEVDAVQCAKLLGRERKPTISALQTPSSKRWSDKRERDEFICNEIKKLMGQGIGVDKAAQRLFEDNKEDFVRIGIKAWTGVKRAYYRSK